MTIEDVITNFVSYQKRANIERIMAAYHFAEEAHRGQLRKSGEPYIIHPLHAAYTLTKLRVDEDTLIAALLHDVPEDTDRNLSQIEDAFGPSVAFLVNGVSKLSKVQYRNNMEEHQIESLRKMFLVMARDLRVVLIKLADRLHNMESLDAVRLEKRQRIAKETLEIFCPLADRLGIWQLKWQLEDLCFKHLHPKEYKALVEHLHGGQKEREQYIEDVVSVLKKELKSSHVKARISGRTKNLYSLFIKMTRKHKSLEEIYDLFAVRVIVPDVKDCYTVLGIIHDAWKPKPGRFKDYIAVPKPNGYQSLHTTVFSVGGRLTEFQIRTERMHEEAEYGMPAHWHYTVHKRKTGRSGAGASTAPKDQMEWVKNLLELQEHFHDSREFLDNVKLDLFTDRIFVFTPQGDVKDLPVGATPIDLAYLIHSDLGHRCLGAKVNGAIVPLDSTLNTGDIVEILSTKDGKGPKRGWLSTVKTSAARNKIRAWFRLEDRDKNLEYGIQMLEHEIQRLFPEQRIQDLPQTRKAKALDYFPYKTMNDLLVSIGEGTISSTAVIKKMYSNHELFRQTDVRPTAIPVVRRLPSDILVGGEKNLPTTLAKCCTPEYPQKILAFITRGKMVTIHQAVCKSLKNLDHTRLLPASWKTDQGVLDGTLEYEVTLHLEGRDRIGMMRDIMIEMADAKVNVINVNARPLEDRTRFADDIIIQIADFSQLSHLFERLEKIEGVEKISRG